MSRAKRELGWEPRGRAARGTAADLARNAGRSRRGARRPRAGSRRRRARASSTPRDRRDRYRRGVPAPAARRPVGEQPVEQPELQAPGGRDQTASPGGRRSARSPAPASAARRPAAREVGPMARQLEREPVLAERAPLPRAPVGDDHGEPAARSQRREDASQIGFGDRRTCSSEWRKTTASNDPARARRSTASRRRPRRPRRAGDARRVRRRLDAEHAPAGVDPRGGEIAAAAADVEQRARARGPAASSTEREAAVAGALHVAPSRVASDAVRKIERCVADRVERAELVLGRRAAASSPSRSWRTAWTGQDPGMPCMRSRRDERRRGRELGPPQARQVRRSALTRAPVAARHRNIGPPTTRVAARRRSAS